MKKGKSLVELAQELQRIQETAKDYVVPVEKVRMEILPIADAAKDTMTATPTLAFANGARHNYPLTKWAHSQVASLTDIPKAYYDRISHERPELLARNVNHGLERIEQEAKAKGKPVSRLIRTVGGQTRAVLSSRFRRLDGFDLAETILPVMADKRFEVVSSEITDRRMYIKALTPKVQAEVKPGDVVQFGLMVSNSDVGSGSVRVEPLIYRLICSNGMISNTAIKKFHVGRDQASDDIQELLADETKELSDQAFWMSVRDVVLAHMRPEVFQREVDKLKEAAGDKITNFDIPEVVELAMKRINVTGEKTRETMVAYLANGADGAGLTRWGLANAFTYAAQADHVGYDDSVDLERAGSQIIELPRKDWSRIAVAAS